MDGWIGLDWMDGWMDGLDWIGWMDGSDWMNGLIGSIWVGLDGSWMNKCLFIRFIIKCSKILTKHKNGGIPNFFNESLFVQFHFDSCLSFCYLYGAEYVVHNAIRRRCQVLGAWIEMVPDRHVQTFGRGSQCGKKSGVARLQGDCGDCRYALHRNTIQ